MVTPILAYLFKLIILLVCFSETANPLLNKMDRRIRKNKKKAKTKNTNQNYFKSTNLRN